MPFPYLFSTLQIAILALSLVSQSGCAQSPPSASVVIQGQITLNDDWQNKLYLLKPDYFSKILAAYEMPIIDTIQLDDDGNFQLKKQLTPESAGLYILVSQKKETRFANALEELPFQENYILLNMEPGTEIRLHSAIDRLTHSLHILEADQLTLAMNDLQEFRLPLVESVESAWMEHPNDNQIQWSPHGDDPVQQAIHKGLDQYLDTAMNFLPLIAALRLRSPGNDYRDRPEFFLRIAAKLESMFPDHTWTKEYRMQLNPDLLPVLTGQQMPPFTLPTPEGDTLHTGDLHGKLILVDFWASWCAPCRKENRSTLRPLYDEFHDKGFNILAISIDSDRNSWINAINKDGAIWKHASDLLGDASPVRQSLKFDTIPACYLLDEDGKLLARNLHGDALQLFVKDYFNGLPE